MTPGEAAEALVIEEQATPVVGYTRLWQLAWPVAISTSTVTLLTLVNLLWIGHLGTVALAAVSICGNILFIVFGLSNIVYGGALAIVSRRVGEGDVPAAFEATLHGIVLGAAIGTLVALVGYASAPAIVGVFGVGAEVEAIAVSYLRIMYVGQIPLFLNVALGASYQASGNTRMPMLINVAVVSLNAVADPFFIFHPGELRLGGLALGGLGWGVDGAAIAAVLSSVLGCFLLFGLSAAQRQPFPAPEHAHIRLSLAQFWHMLRIGSPASIGMIARPLRPSCCSRSSPRSAPPRSPPSASPSDRSASTGFPTPASTSPWRRWSGRASARTGSPMPSRSCAAGW